MISAIVYVLCTFTALACCVLLLRGYGRSKAPLLLWSGLCFAFLTLENLMLFLDRVIFATSYDLSGYRAPLGLVAMFLLLYGIAWKTN